MNLEEYEARRPRPNRCSPTVFEYGTMPPAEEIGPWREWLTRHGIDPNHVVIPGRIERLEAERQITYVAYVPDGQGRPLFDRDREDFVTETRTAQLDQPPAPFPPFAEAGG